MTAARDTETRTARPWRDWLVVGQEEWDEVERRNQLIVRAVAGRHPRARFLFAEIPLRPSQWRQWRRPRPRQVAENVWVVRAIRPLPGRRFARFSDRVEARTLQRAMWKLAIEQPLVWTQDPRAEDLFDELPAAQVVYDLTDDWAAFEDDPARRAEVQAKIEQLGARADVVLACSRSLEAGARAWAPQVRYLPNAVEGPSVGGPVPPELGGLPRPILGYAGTQHPSRLDVELLAGVAEARPDWSFVLLGPDALGEAAAARLLSLPNVHHLGVRPHRVIRDYLSALDVCLIPHLVNDFTRSLDPLKLYEYLAAGRPVVATPVGNAPEFDAHVRFGVNVESFAAACEEAVRDDSEAAIAARRAAVAGETWEARAEVIETLVCDPPDAPVPGRVDVVVVSFNTRELLERCLLAVRAQVGADVHAIVVDNASTDGSVELVRERFPEVELVELGENRGFGAANNIAFERCRGEFVLLLNSDAFLQPDSVARLVEVARRRPDAGAVGPRLLNEDGSLQRSAWPFPSAGRLLLEAVGAHLVLRRLGLLEDLGTWAHDEERDVDFLIGACLLMRLADVREVGGFDEGFWLYAEETDLLRRVADRGWRVTFTPSTSVVHIAGASSTASAPRLRTFYAGQQRYLRKHRRAGAPAAALAAQFVGSVLRRRWASAAVALRMGLTAGARPPR